jgi:ankyrin repeat protein
MVRYFLTDLRGNPIYSFAQRLRRNNHHHRAAAATAHHARLAQQLFMASAANPTMNSSNDSSSLSSSPSSSMSNFVTTTLVCHIRNRAWEEVLKRIASHPAEVAVMDGSTGNTVLHAACRLNPPPEVIRALIAQLPTLARAPNREGATPLHIAASHRCSAAAIQALLDGCQQQQQQQQHDQETAPTHHSNHNDQLSTSPTADLSRMGRAPIHYACMSFRGLEIDAFLLLLDATLSQGNVWVYEELQHLTPFTHMATGENYGDQDLYFSSHFSTKQHESSHCMMEEEEEEDVDDEHSAKNHHYDHDIDLFDFCEFAHELDKDLYQQNIDDLTVLSDSKQEEAEPKKILVNVMGIKDATGQTPLGLLFCRYRERVRCVINTVDRLRTERDSHPDRAALVAAVRVHADLGELWEKARLIVARLTEERLRRETMEQQQQEQTLDSETNAKAKKKKDKNKITIEPQQDATSRRATFYGSAISATSCYYDSSKFIQPPSPAEAAVAQVASSWAVEQHPERNLNDQDEVVLPMVDPHVSANTIEHLLGNGSYCDNAGLKKDCNLAVERKFRIVHASVGLTGYGCPPELIRLAISIHPHQVMEMDDDGNLPLHIAVTAASYLATAHALASSADPDASPLAAAAAVAAAAASDNSNADDHSVMSDAAMSFFSTATVANTTNPFDKVIKILLQHYPKAAYIPQGKTGRLPLVLAIESGRRTWNDGIRTLLNAYPPALHNKKLIEPALYPHVLSLVANNGNSMLHQAGGGCCAFDFGGGIVDFLNGAGVEKNPRKTKISKRAIRQETCSRTTLYELLRSKPDWLSLGYEKQEKENREVELRL